ncbi:vascular endothelial growth factor receptor 1-like isoform X1 [Linepithema humile]|uniref:vascular endothelial growth factor receptor 1-like isoform X1 n=1 Tax=Linepithema humile TaxID=83485 RepID=UPI00351EE199
MFFNTRFFVLVLIIVFSLWKVSESSKPIISSSQEKVTYKGKNLEITCNSTRIKFIYSNTIKDEINTSTPTMIDTEENGIYKFVFQRLNTVFGDTGWHGCANYNVDIIPNSYDNPEVNWIYVYVKSSTHFFVEADISAHLRAIVGNDLAVPCRTTSREIIPVLYVHDDEETEKPFDLRISFRFKSLTLKDSDWYKCSIEKDGILHKVNYVLFVDQILPEPIIDDGTLHHVIRGENLHVNCTVQVETSMRYTFDWITPQQNNSRIQIHHFRKDLDENNLEVTRQLTILNVTNEDEGEYECFIRSGYKKKTTRNITIHDIRKRYINLTSQHPVKLYQQGIGSSVEWVVFFDGYPKPICLEWYKHNYKLVGEDNYSINTSSTFTIFKIKSLRKMDEGVYTLVAENHYITKKLNFALKVIDKPIPTLENIKFYYAPNENAEFHCTSLSYVFSNITWNFLKCIDFPSCKNSTTIQLTNANLKSEGSFMLYKRFTSKVKMPIEISGKITCVACNAVGCDVSVSSIFVSDGIGNFSIIGPKELVIKGDDVEFTCVASVSYYTDKLKWENSNKTLLAESERLHIKQHKTLFSHRSTVKINNVQKSDAMAYICVGESTSLDTIADETYELVVHDPVRPFFHETNMNETEVRDIDRIADDYSTLTLKCFVNGMPKPNVTWYKDNTTLKENDQYSFKSDHQELYIKYLKQNDYGKYLCRATNRFDTNETYQQIRITNISAIDNFSIIGPKESVIKGDKVSKITCVASISYYTDELTWANLNKTKRLRIVQNNTLFTYRSTLEIVNVQESDAKDYTCVGKYISNNVTFLQTRRYELVVHDPVSPFFYKTNMNETIARDIEMIPGRNETVTLQCFAKGMPIPIMAWFKDNTLLEENDQYSFKSNYQELNIKHLDKYNGGKYLCRATNRFGSKETYQLIIIKSVKIEEQKPDVILAISIAVLGIISMILAIFITIKVRREKKLKRELMEAGLMHFVDGALECLNPDLTIDEQAELLPYDKKFEFPRGRLKLGKQLGSGAFGVVMKAEALGICKNEMVTTVAVKIVRRTTDLTYIRALSNELKIMIHLGKHLNVVNLLGACTKNIFKHELLVIVEYCCFGNLQNYLLKHRTNFINQIDSKTGKIVHNIGTDILTKTANVNSNNSFDLNSDSDTATRYCSKTVNTDYKETSCSTDGYIFSDNSSQPDWRSNYRGDYKDQNFKPICTQDLLSWAFQIARGMEYLSQRKVLHGDLAARNILLTEDNVVKICDFGLAKSMYKDGNYKKKGDGPLPIKWMAIESMKDYIFSTQSDVWSFGIMLWEFFTLAETPYPGIEVEKLYQKLIEGYRMEQPEYAFREVYDIMLQCWKAEPTLRPDFTNLVESIGNLIEENMKSHYINLNIPYMNMNAIILESGKTDYLTMLSAPDHATLSSSSQDNVNTPLSEDASNSAYLCMSPGFQTDKSLIFSPTPHQDTSELPPSASNLEGTLKLSPVKQTDEIKSTEQFNVEQIDSKSNDYASSVIRTSNNYVNMSKQKSDLSKNMPDCFNNPNYVMQNNREIDQTISI